MKNLFQKMFWGGFAIFACLTLWTSYAFSQANTWPDFRGNMIGVPLTSSSGVTNPMTADLDMGTFDLKNGDDWYGTSAATDVAPKIRTITGEEPYAPASPPATRPTNTTGGNIVWATPNGDRRLGSAGANGLCVADPCVYAAGATITIPTQTDGVQTSCVLTSAAGTDAATRTFLCDGQTPAVCAANIVTAASTVSPCSLMTVVSANETVSFSRKAGPVSYIGDLVPSAAGITAQNGIDGQILAIGGTAARPQIVSPASPTTGIGTFSSAYPNSICISISGICVFEFAAGGVVSTQSFTAGAAAKLAWNTRSAMQSTADGAWKLTKTTDVGSFIISVANLLKGQTATLTTVPADCTFPGGGGAATCVTSAFIPLGASILSVSGRQVTPGTTCTTCTAGLDTGAGLDADQLGAALECDVDNTLYTTATATANVMGSCLLAGGCTLTMTAVGGNCVSGVAAWTVTYLASTAATAD